MSDFSEALAKAFQEQFPSAIQGKCYYHLKSNIKKRYSKKTKHLEKYLESLAACTSNSQLDALWKIIKKDICLNSDTKEFAKDFVEYFEKTYMLANNKNFHVGALPPGFSNNNNMLEGHHRFLKKEIYEYEVLDMGKLITAVKFII